MTINESKRAKDDAWQDMKYLGTHAGKMEGQGSQPQTVSRETAEGYTAADIPELRDEYRQAIAFFDDGQFESPTHRMRCVDFAHELRDMLEALGEDVMSADHLSSLIGDR